MKKRTKLFLGGLMLCSLFVLSTNKSHAWKLFGNEEKQVAYVGGQVCVYTTTYMFGIVVGTDQNCIQL